VLEAVKEVQDNVEALHWLADESGHTAAAATAARKAADMSMALYKDGAASFLDVYTAESAALDAQRLAIGLHTRELEATIGLMLALGGGWSPLPPNPAATTVPLSSMVPALAAGL
jgi:outer membrane protein TolC